MKIYIKKMEQISHIACLPRKSICLILTLFLSVCLPSCKKYIDVDAPNTSLTSGNVYSTDITAIAVVSNLYAQLSGDLVNGNNICSLSLLGGLSADELTLASGGSATQVAYYQNSLFVNAYPSTAAAGPEIWNDIYPAIFICNDALAGINASTKLSPGIKKQLLGEVKFLRGFYYFYLTTLYGDVPLALSNDPNVNANLQRTSQDKVYQQVISDLNEAISLLSANYLDGTLTQTTTERVRPTQSVGAALLARVYLYAGQFANAKSQADAVINNSIYGLVPLNNVFLRNNNEAIWQLQSVGVNQYSNTSEAVLFNISYVPVGFNSAHPVYLSNALLNSFEFGDQRKMIGNWINIYTDGTGSYYYPYKYKATSTTTVSATEYRTMFRLGEQFLIRAEAEAQLGDMTDAAKDLNVIRNRAGLPPSTALTASSTLAQAMSAILHERQTELFTEMGNRWLDLKRTGTIDAVMTTATAAKGGTWSSFQQLYPLPASDIQWGVNLRQNTGY